MTGKGWLCGILKGDWARTKEDAMLGSKQLFLRTERKMIHIQKMNEKMTGQKVREGKDIGRQEGRRG